jgi:tRNA (adenine22-N1)-methyltransferase
VAFSFPGKNFSSRTVKKGISHQDCEKIGRRRCLTNSTMDLQLSPRLMAIAKYVLPDLPAADIGSDHAYLPSFLLLSGRVSRAIVVENSPGPWNRARHQVQARDLSGKIDVRLGDGLEPLQPGEATMAIIAGMGGGTITGILARGGHVLPTIERLVLQPMSGVSLVRKWLFNHGWGLVDEELVQEGERIYVILVAEKKSKVSVPGELDLEVGPVLKEKKHPLLAAYLERKKKRYLDIWRGLSRSRQPAAAARRQDIEKKIMQLEEVIRCLSHAKK